MTDSLVGTIPDRYEVTSVKAKLSWFGALCVSGAGMFVEAFVIITTGQIKTTWNDQFPECFVPNANQNCPENIQCCGLFPNTSNMNSQCDIDGIDYNIADGTCQEDGTYPSNVLCSSVQTGALS